LQELRRQGIGGLDLVILTHPHDDHLGGLNQILGVLPVASVIDDQDSYSSQAYQRFRSLIAMNAIKYSIGYYGQLFDLGGGISLEVLNSAEPGDDDCNANSLVTRLAYGRFSLLLTGDLNQAREPFLCASQAGHLQSTVLKVGHHGSQTSTSPDFIQLVKPSEAVISVGRHNKYRHPHRSLLDRLAAAQIRIWRTDRQGNITLKTDGENYSIVPQK